MHVLARRAPLPPALSSLSGYGEKSRVLHLPNLSDLGVVILLTLLCSLYSWEPVIPWYSNLAQGQESWPEPDGKEAPAHANLSG